MDDSRRRCAEGSEALYLTIRTFIDLSESVWTNVDIAPAGLPAVYSLLEVGVFSGFCGESLSEFGEFVCDSESISERRWFSSDARCSRSRIGTYPIVHAFLYGSISPVCRSTCCIPSSDLSNSFPFVCCEFA